MIKLENIQYWGFEHAVRGMRNPLNSWSKSDSIHDHIGDADLDLMHRLYEAGPEHRKYLRQIFVSMDITAPLYWWKEMDQYRIGVTTNSCSTMHKIAAKEFELEDFSLNLATYIYFAGGMCEQLGIRDDISKAVYKEMYHSQRASIDKGTISDKDSLAELASQQEYLVSVCYTRAYKTVKSKVENAQELLSAVKKVLSRRMQEQELTRMGN